MRFTIKKYCDDNIYQSKYAIYVFSREVNDYVFYMGNMSLQTKNYMVESLILKGWTNEQTSIT